MKRVDFDRVLELAERGCIWFMIGPEGGMTLRFTEDVSKDTRYRDHVERTERTEHVERMGRSEHVERLGRSEHVERMGHSEHVEHTGRTERVERTGPLPGYVLLLAGTAGRLRLPSGARGILRNGFPAVDGEVIRPGDFLQIREFSFYFMERRLWTQNRDDLVVHGIMYENLPDRNSYPAFQRNTRIQSYMDEEPVEILDPPPLPVEQEGNLALRLLPSLGMLAAAGLMAAKGGTTMLVFSGISAGTGVVTAVAGTLRSGKKYRKNIRKRQQVYQRYLDGKREDLEKARELECRILRSGYPDLEELMHSLFRFAPDLFERRMQDEDFLTLRLGTGHVRSKKPVHYRAHEQLEALDELSMMPEQIGQEYMWLKDVPVVCDLKETAVLGIAGKETERYAFLRNIVLDAALHHYHSDVKMIFIAEKKHADRLHWLRFLPHAYLEPQFVRGLALDAESRNSMFEYIYRELSRRRDEGMNPRKDAHFLIFFYDDVGFREHPISRFLPDAGELGVSFFFFADTRAELVQGCSQVIEIRHPGAAEMVDALNYEHRAYFSFSAVGEKKAEECVRFLAPVYTREVSLDSTLTNAYSLFQMLGVRCAEELIPHYGPHPTGLSASGHTLAAPVGIGRCGRVFLDIHDTAHGPHGLVAGTTGSGKSEFLQTYILSMAVLYSPHEVGFLIIDYKGGGMAAPFSVLPHLLGTITNIDGMQASRALRSIRAELVKRQQLFEKAGVNHIDRYMKLRGINEPLPHLIIIIDEFAELKAARPEFMQELISAARIGRSLGVHLILATQKPSGQVSEQIWSNSRFRICMKVQEEADSKEVLKSPLAAEIREAGRAYLQVGNGEVFELFQAAYSGCPADTQQQQKPYSIYQVSDTGTKTLIYQKNVKADIQSPSNPKDTDREDVAVTQMDAVIRRICRYCEEQGIRKLPDIFCPALADVIPYQFRSDFAVQKETVQKGTGQMGIVQAESVLYADIGWYDDPDHQLQAVYTLDLSQRNVLIAGSSRSGKTTMLRILVRDLALRYTPEQLHIYIVDYASRELTRLHGLPHVGGVVCPSDREKTESLFRMLTEEMEHRKAKMAAEGILSEEMPHILLVVDHLQALKELMFQDDQRLLALCSEGLQTKIHVAASNPQASSVGFRYLSAFGEKIALHCNDSNEYHYLFDHPKELPEDVPGRFVTQKSGILYHGQCYQATDYDMEQTLLTETQRVMQTSARQLPKPIPQVPEVLKAEELVRCSREEGGWEEGSRVEGIRDDQFYVPIGITLTDIRPFFLDLSAQDALLIAGNSGRGRHNWICWLDHYLQAYYPGRYQYYIVDGIYRRLKWMTGKTTTAFYTTDLQEAGTMILLVESMLKERYDALLHPDDAGPEGAINKPYDSKKQNLLVILIDASAALEIISHSPEAMSAWRCITGRYKSLRVCPIITGVDNTPISFQAPEILRDLREMKNCLFFGDLKTFRLFEIPYALSRQPAVTRKPGEAWYISGADHIPIKTPLCNSHNTDGIPGFTH